MREREGPALMLAASGLVKRYGATVALDGCSLEVRRGRMLGFLGPNGAGKTTAMRAIFGLVELDAGSITWEGRAVDAEVRARFGYMPEQRGLYPRMRIGAQLAHLARLHGIDRATAAEQAERWLAELGLADRVGDPLDALSHGNQQRVQLAAALVHEPELLVLDEPLSGLDPLGVESMERVLREQARRGAAIVFSSHQLDLVQAICDDVVVIANGRDVMAGTLEELRAESDSRRVELRFADGVRWDPTDSFPDATVVEADGGRVRLLVSKSTNPERVLAAARTHGEVEDFTFQPPSLSELFREAVTT